MPFSLKFFLLGVKKHNCFYLRLVSPPSGWRSPIGQSAHDSKSEGSNPGAAKLESLSCWEFLCTLKSIYRWGSEPIRMVRLLVLLSSLESRFPRPTARRRGRTRMSRLLRTFLPNFAPQCFPLSFDTNRLGGKYFPPTNTLAYCAKIINYSEKRFIRSGALSSAKVEVHQI